jgi:hypothetical protein
MALRYRARPGRLLAIVLAGVAFALTFGAAAAYAADSGAVSQTQSFEDIFLRLQETPVYKDACTKTCHGNIAATKNYASAIIFKHGYHQLVACSSCHPRFPHRKDTTIERPSMKGCFDCHGVRHGPMGLIASNVCNDCHVTDRSRLRPAFHTYNWAGLPHVAPANKEFNTRCAMCHTPETCTDCHDQKGIEWSPDSWDYNAGDGCLACHGNAALTKQASEGIKSFAVVGLSDSAHQDLTCQQCHVDYRYDDKPAATPLWSVNAGLACAACHSDSKDKASRDAVAAYNKSIHAEKIRSGNYDSATCSSCHGGHYIFKLDTAASKASMHRASYRVCARCHDDKYASYNDYYHGKAYKKGALDAPACWDCHEAHDVLPSADPKSSVNAANVGATCGRPGCHKGSGEKFGESAARLIHEKVEAENQNPLLRIVNKIRGIK